MAFETKEQILEKILAQDKPNCPHCGIEMKIWEVPPFAMDDGLGWGVPYLFLCFNDDCPMYVQGWDNIEKNYGHTASYRCICYPGAKNFECMPVFSSLGATGNIVDEQVLAAQETLKEKTKKGFLILAGCYVEKDPVTVLKILLDANEPTRVRVKAAEMIGDIGELEAIEALNNQQFGHKILQQEVDKAVIKIHERFFTRECPFCAEIIKKRAKICKHCGKDVD